MTEQLGYGILRVAMNCMCCEAIRMLSLPWNTITRNGARIQFSNEVRFTSSSPIPVIKSSLPRSTKRPNYGTPRTESACKRISGTEQKSLPLNSVRWRANAWPRLPWIEPRKYSKPKRVKYCTRSPSTMAK